MKSVPLTVFPRAAVRRPGVKKLRAASRVPAVIYGRRRPQPQNLEIQLKELEGVIHRSVSENILVSLSVSGDLEPGRLALVQEVQHNPLTGQILHVDFHEIAEDERVTISVPVEPVGEAVGVRNGGTLKVRALPKDLPEVLAVDVSHLEIGQAVHIGDIPAVEGVEILGGKTVSVLAVAAPVAEVEEAPATAAVAGAQPEVIAEKKDDTAAPAAADSKPAKPEKAAKAEKK
jgi:large subunit ribosomal protein L25